MLRKKLRDVAVARYGKRKGYLGKAVTEAVEEWARKTEEVDINAHASAMLKKGFNLGGLKTKNRSEWHER